MSQKPSGEPKVALRESVLALRQRNSQNDSQRAGLTASLCTLRDRLGAKIIATYLSFGTEPSTRDFIADCNALGLKVLTPQALSDRKLAWVETDLAHLESGSLGFEEALGVSGSLREADLILAPALAIDHSGNRLGRGGGYFDVALTEKAPTQPVYGVVFEREFLKIDIPSEWHDVPVDGVVTEVAIYEIGAKA